MSKSFGVVKWFDNERGFGFILNKQGQDVFFHYADILKDGYKTIQRGCDVAYDQEETDKGLQAKAVDDAWPFLNQ